MEFYYTDRPALSATEQVSINIHAILEPSIMLTSEDVVQEWFGEVVEVRDEDGMIDGTLIYIPGKSLAELITPGTDEVEGETADDDTVYDDHDVDDEVEDGQ